MPLRWSRAGAAEFTIIPPSLSDGARQDAAMQNDHQPRRMTIHVKIRLEPELEMMAATWSPAQCDEHAAKLERFARQLRVKANILRRDQVPLSKKLRWQQPGITLKN